MSTSAPVSTLQRARQRVERWACGQADAYRSSTDEPRPLGGYAVAMTGYAAGLGVIALMAKITGRRGPQRVTPWDVALLGLATHKLSRTLAKDAVTSPVRAPFTSYAHPSGDAELAEEVRSHGGVKHAIGELITCPFCLAQWTATAFTAGAIFAPTATRFAATTMAGVAVSDYLQLGYAALQKVAE